MPGIRPRECPALSIACAPWTPPRGYIVTPPRQWADDFRWTAFHLLDAFLQIVPCQAHRRRGMPAVRSARAGRPIPSAPGPAFACEISALFPEPFAAPPLSPFHRSIRRSPRRLRILNDCPIIVSRHRCVGGFVVKRNNHRYRGHSDQTFPGDCRTLVDKPEPTPHDAFPREARGHRQSVLGPAAPRAGSSISRRIAFASASGFRAGVSSPVRSSVMISGIPPHTKPRWEPGPDIASNSEFGEPSECEGIR